MNKLIDIGEIVSTFASLERYNFIIKQNALKKGLMKRFNASIEEVEYSIKKAKEMGVIQIDQNNNFKLILEN